MKKYIINLILLCLCFGANAQSFDADKVAFTNFLVRMYKHAPFEGVRAVEDDNANAYLISVLSLEKEKYKTEPIMNRVAGVKAMSQASTFFNGAKITADLIIRTKETSSGESEVETIESINEKSSGMVKSLEQLTNFVHPSDPTRIVFIYMTPKVE